MLWAAPPCSTWVFLSSGSTGRHRDVRGNPDSPYIVSQNALVERLLVVCRVCLARRVHFIIEQPSSSCMWNYPAFVRFLERHGQGRIARVRLQMGAFGMEAVKDTVLLGSAPYLPLLERRMDAQDRQALREGSRLQVVHKYVDVQGRKRCHGARDLKATQSYPMGFGAAHALAFQRHDLAVATATPSGSSATAGPSSTLRGPAPATADPLSDSEDDWFLEDLKTWDANRWHRNTEGEHQLRLLAPGEHVPSKKPRN